MHSLSRFPLVEYDESFLLREKWEDAGKVNCVHPWIYVLYINKSTISHHLMTYIHSTAAQPRGSSFYNLGSGPDFPHIKT